MRNEISDICYLDLTDGVSVVATAEVPPPAPTPDPGQTVPVAGPTGLVVSPGCPGDRRAVQPDPAPFTGGVSGAQPEGVAAHLAVHESLLLIGVHLGQVPSYFHTVSLGLAPGLPSGPQSVTLSWENIGRDRECRQKKLS